MNISFAEHVIECRAWESKGEMVDFLRQCDAGAFLLGEDAEQEGAFYSVAVHLNYSAKMPSMLNEIADGRLGIGICSEGHGLKPHLLLLPEKQALLLGFNREAVGIDIRDCRIRSRTLFNRSPFRSFVHLSRMGLILALHEIGVVALNEEGEEVWAYNKDIIVDCSIEREQLQLKFMDSPTVWVNVLNGSVVTKTL